LRIAPIVPTAAALAIFLGGAGGSAAETPPATGVRLEVQRGAGAETCSDEKAIQEGVVKRLRHDPFTAPVHRIVVASIRRTEQGYSANVSLQDVDGTPLGLQRLDYQIASCDELAAAIELAIAVAIDPVLAQQGPAQDRSIVRTESIPTTTVVVPALPAAAAAATPKEVEPAPAANQPSSNGSPEESALGWRFWLGAGVAFGSEPTAVPTLSTGLELHIANASVGLQFRADFAGHRAAAEGSISTYLLMGELVPCYHRGWLGVCGLIDAGARHSTGVGLEQAHTAITSYFALGARLELDVPIVPGWFWIRPEADVSFPTTSVTLNAAGAAAWESPPVSAVVGVAFVLALR
jgi:hypothetical protein